MLTSKMSCGVSGASSSPDDVDCAEQDAAIRSKTAIFRIFGDAIVEATLMLGSCNLDHLIFTRQMIIGN